MNRYVKKLNTLISKFEATASKYSKFGARDTEPDGVFQWCLVRAFKGKEFEIPTTANRWELYSDTPGVGLAAANLGRAVKRVVDFIRSVPLGSSGYVEDTLRNYCWRIDW